MNAEPASTAAEHQLGRVLLRSRQSAAFGGVMCIGWGLALQAGGSRTIDSLLVRALWPAYVLGGLLSVAWYFRPSSDLLARLGGTVLTCAWLARAAGAVAWGLGTGNAWSSQVALVVCSHLFVADLIAVSTVYRVVPLAKGIQRTSEGGFTFTGGQ